MTLSTFCNQSAQSFPRTWKCNPGPESCRVHCRVLDLSKSQPTPRLKHNLQIFTCNILAPCIHAKSIESSFFYSSSSNICLRPRGSPSTAAENWRSAAPLAVQPSRTLLQYPCHTPPPCNFSPAHPLSLLQYQGVCACLLCMTPNTGQTLGGQYGSVLPEQAYENPEGRKNVAK